jgi:S1-C subfamily serine protease
VIQLQNASGLTTANLGDSSSVQNGDAVTALGNAGGKGGTPSVATGAVTALNQSITASDEGSGVNSEQLTGLIETNANIQPGDSGGALVNSYGQVIGMNTAASSGTETQSESGQSAAAQAYAIPIDKAESIAKQIEAGQGSSTVHIGATAFLGIESGGSNSGSGSGSGSGNSGGFGDGSGFGGFGGFGDGSGFGSQGGGSGTNGSGTSNGVTIAGTLSGSAAANAGLTAGDTITSVDGQAISSTSDIEQALVKHHPGDKISVNWVDQNGQSQTATVTLGSGPAA